MEKKQLIFLAVIVLLIIIPRFIFLELRVLHHDEAVNYFFASKIISGEGFVYNPFDYHGPFYFFAIALSFLLFEISEFSLRLPSVLFGILLALSPFLFKIGNKKERAFISVFLLLSPSIFYYSRYSVHEISFVFFSLAGFYYFSKILEKESLEKLPFFAGALAFLFTIKETVIILMPVFFIIGIINLKRVKKIEFKKNSGIIFFSALIFILIYVSFFTSFFTNTNGLSDSFKSFMPWIDRGVNEVGHDKPFFYYSLLLLKYELPIVLLGLLGILYGFTNFREACKSQKISRFANFSNKKFENSNGENELFKFLFKRGNIFITSIGIWLVLGFFIYSLIPYKTPWLVVNITAPLCFMAGFGAYNLYKKKKTLSLIAIILAVVYLGYFSLNTSFISPESNDFAYVHTDKDILELVGKINENHKEEDRILVASAKYWPLPFYLRGKSISYLDSEEFYDYTDYEDYDFFIFRERVFDRIGVLEGGGNEEYKLHPGERLVLVWRKV